MAETRREQKEMHGKSTHRRGQLTRRGLALAAAAALSAASMLLLSTTASATLVHTHSFISSFDGTGSKTSTEVTGPFGTTDHIAINQVDSTVYVSDQNYGGVVDKFFANGTPQQFSGLAAGVTAVNAGGIGGDNDLALDNSGTSSQGQFYAFQEGQKLHAFSSSGVELGAPNFPIEPLGDMCGGAVDPSGNFWWSVFGGGLTGFSSGGSPLNKNIPVTFGNCHVAIDQSQPPSPTSGYFYIQDWGSGTTTVYNPAGVEKYVLDTEGSKGLAIDPSTGNIYIDHFTFVSEYAPSTTSTPGALLSKFGGPDPVHGFPSGLCEGSRGVAVNETTHNVYVTDCGRVDIFGPGVEFIVPTVVTDTPSVQPSTAILRGHVDPDGGGDTTDCHFEWGLEASYGNTAPCVPAGPIHNADGNTAVSAEISNLEAGTTYHFRLVASNGNGQGAGSDQEFKPQGPPVISKEFTSDVNTDGARINGTVAPEGGETTYHFEYGLDTSYGTSVPIPDASIASTTQKQAVTRVITGLVPGATYHFRVVAKNQSGTTPGTDGTFRTYAPYPGTADDCSNAQARKQTGAGLLLDCRSYELASAPYSGGYDVQSDLIPGQSPPVAYPSAPDRLLYSLHYGAIPGVAGNPPNLSLDPYVAERGASGWTTRYVGISASGAPSAEAFGSPLESSSASLSTFVFGGEKLCAPCFADGSTGVPVRNSDGSLVQGMAGSLNPGPGAIQAGYIGRALSSDGSHLVFGSTSKFEPDGNSNGDVSLYDRNLTSGTTHVVSKKADGSGTMTGAGIGELDISGNGSRILIGKKVSSDAAGNAYWHLYMNIGDSAQTVDLMPTAVAGALYDWMTADGSRVFFSTPDKLGGGDSDNSADLYEADVAGDGSVTIGLVSAGAGGATNSDACNPIPGKKALHWNNVVGASSCDAVGFSGGAGVAANDGTIYFLSPEKLDGNGSLNSPNLFVKRPGSVPRLVATIEPDNPAVLDAVSNNEARGSADIQVTPSGEDAVFASRLPLTGYTNLERSEIFRYDDPANALECVSCAATGAAPTTDSMLSPFGLNISNDGRVFFTSSEQLALRDTNKQRDAYEWENGVVELISSGSSSTGSGLASVSANGTDAFFFTRQVLAPQDHNGTSMKIYDARVDGGFFADVQAPPCQASDECHGPGTTAAPPAQIATLRGSVGNTTGGNVGCSKGFVKKHGKCIKKPKKRHSKKRSHRASSNHRNG
jgi:hypothetical protein